MIQNFIKKGVYIAIILCTFSFYAQIRFEKGYFIDNNGVKTECYIKNKPFSDNPKYFKYKLNPDEKELKEIDITNIKELGIDNTIKYVKKEVKYDISSQSLNELTEKRDPIWENKTLLLSVLIEGDATLYEYLDKNLPKYFYELGDTPIEQLVYKRYYNNNIANNPNNSTIAINNDFQKQLFEKLNYQNAQPSFFLEIKYNKKSLSDYFKAYNLHKNNTVIQYNGNIHASSMNFKLQSGIMKHNLRDNSSQNQTVAYSEKNPFLTLGAEIEYLFFRNKWATFLNTNFQKFNYKVTTTDHYSPNPLFDRVYTADVDINYLAVYFGAKHYMYINKNSSLYIGLSILLTEKHNTKIKGETDNHEYSIPIKNLILGYSYKSKLFIETRDGNSLILSYKLFDSNKKKSSK
ncbi:hypothetical protein [Flavobacterium sp. H122]|uniref:hypothetical protein n=1 Tax=Flavobacterium sp. H122 TaxID=2529860 RepID=UPI0010A99E1A|nr:hypothetical protein [Flavobacterium sp. H122]